jgi:hypothetical protein
LSTSPRTYFVVARRQKMSFQGFRSLDTSLYRLKKSHFATSRMQVMSSQGHSTTWNFVSSNSSKLHFWLRRRQRISSHGLSTPWNIALSTKRKSHFGPIIRQKMNSQSESIPCKNFTRSCQSLIWCGPESRKFVRRVLLTLRIMAFSALPKSRFWTSGIQKMSSQSRENIRNDAFWTSTKAHFATARRLKMSSQGFSSTWNRLPEFTQDAFWEIQKEEYEFSGLFHYLKHHFLDLSQVALWAGYKVENQSYRWQYNRKNAF